MTCVMVTVPHVSVIKDERRAESLCDERACDKGTERATGDPDRVDFSLERAEFRERTLIETSRDRDPPFTEGIRELTATDEAEDALLKERSRAAWITPLRLLLLRGKERVKETIHRAP